MSRFSLKKLKGLMKTKINFYKKFLFKVKSQLLYQSNYFKKYRVNMS